MKRSFRLHPAAKRELQAAAGRYDDELPGLGDDFADAIETGIAQVLERPEAWKRIESSSAKPLRRYLLHRFPFALIYYLAQDTIHVVAIAHAKRKPNYWRQRVEH